GDDSRNNWFLALFTMGEGWHNNHHAYQSSVRQGFRWWEYDATFYVLKLLSWLGIVWDLKAPPALVVRGEHRLGARVIRRAAAELGATLHREWTAPAMSAALEPPQLTALQASLAATQTRATEVLASLHLPHLPTREEIRAKAAAMYAKTPSLDDIADRAHALLLDAVGARLCAVTVPVRAASHLPKTLA